MDNAIGFPKPEKRKKQDKVGEWAKVRDNEIIPQFKVWGIYVCEIQLDGCRKFIYLGFAHTKKRRDINTPEDLRMVVLACDFCHHIVEYFCVQKTGKTMQAFLEGIIEKRMERLRLNGVIQ